MRWLLVRLPYKLARSAARPRAQTYSSECPEQLPLLGGGYRDTQNLTALASTVAVLVHRIMISHIDGNDLVVVDEQLDGDAV